MSGNRLRRFWPSSNLRSGTARVIRLFLPRGGAVSQQGEAPPTIEQSSIGGTSAKRQQQVHPVATVPPVPQPQRDAKRISVCLADVRPEPVRWLWPGRIPLGKLTILDGDPDVGKSLLTLDIAARVSRGGAFPDGSPCTVGSVVVLNAEDGVADTVVPRLQAAGADMSRIHTIRVIPQPSGDRVPDIVTDAALIEMEVRHLGAVLIVIDPLNAYLPGSINTWNDHHIRRALAPFVGVAERTGAAVIVIRHLNKRETPNALYRGGGSIAFVAAARAAFLVAKHPRDSSLRVFAAVKMNLAAKPPSLAYRISVRERVACIEWTGPVDLEADDLLTEQPNERRSELTRAIEFLQSFLKDGPKPAEEAKNAASQVAISERTLKRAKGAIGIMAQREGYGAGGRWFWRLPEGQSPKEGQPTHAGTLAPFDAKLEALLKELGDGPEIEIDWDAPEQT
jgi:hypothetical protein